MKELLELYLIFAKIGSVNFGGGYAMLPLLERELVTDRGWVTTDELMDYFAIGQCTPGIIALNVSTFIGRFIPGIRQLISIPAGLSRMHFGSFLWWTFLGAFIWNCILAAIGYLRPGRLFRVSAGQPARCRTGHRSRRFRCLLWKGRWQ